MDIRKTYLYRQFRIQGTRIFKKIHNRNKNRRNKQITVIFESFAGKKINDNPWAIYLELKKIKPDWNLIWSVNKNIVPEAKRLGVDYVIRRRPKWAKLYAMADGRVVNMRQISWFTYSNPIDGNFKRYTLQTWHGTPLKRLGLDIENVAMPRTTTALYKGRFIREAEKWNALISPNKYSTEIFKRSFDFHGTILETGYPRNVELIENKNNSTRIDQLKEELGIPTDKKIILYAPTYRDDQNMGYGKYTFSMPFSIAKLQKQFGKDIFVITRMHYLISDQLDFSKKEKFIKDFSNHENINELFLVADALITDYSSVMFDYALLNRPIIFYPYDIDKYKDIRNFYFDYEKLPGPIVTTKDELYNEIEKTLKNKFKLSPNQIKWSKKYQVANDQKATVQVTNFFIKKVKQARKNYNLEKINNTNSNS